MTCQDCGCSRSAHAKWCDAAQEIHPDDLAVDRFAVAMKAKLAKKRAEGRGGWEDPEQTEVSYLAELLVEHLAKGDPIDIANFAMMLHQRDAGPEVLRSATYNALERVRSNARRLADEEHRVRVPTVTIDGVTYVPRGAK